MAMSLRIKLPLFIVLIVFIASVTILWVSVHQTRKRGERNIADIRTIETARVKNVLKEHVNFIYSLVNAQHQRSLSSEKITSILNEIKSVTYDNGRGYLWISDTCDAPKLLIHPFLENLGGTDSMKVLSLIKSVNQAVRKSGERYLEFTWPKPDGNYLSDSVFSKLCYAKLYRPLGWVIGSGRYTDEIDEIIKRKIAQTKEEITVTIRDRIIFAVIVLLISTLAIFIFTGTITRPINKFAVLTEDITSERKGYSERIGLASRDEIGRLARSFNTMLGHIEATMNKLEENGRKYRELVENANSAIIRIDSEGNILFFNEYAQKLFGYAAEEIRGRNIADIFAPPADGSPEDSSSILREVLHSPEKNLYSEEEVVAKSGEKKWVAWANRPLYDERHDLKEILCVGSDITARKKAEHLAEMQQRRLIQTDKMATLGILVSGIAHEINNPNNFIILNSENLIDMWNDIRPVLDEHYERNPGYALAGLSYEEMREELPGLLRSITDGSHRIKRIVQGLKDFSRQDLGDPNQSVDISRVVEAATVILGNLIKNSTQRFEVIAREKVPEVKGNFQRLEQVVINLITNACEATDDAAKPITVTISFEPDAKRVSLTVIDWGQGIKPENMKYIMDPFFTTKRDSGGTGLGLAISYSIIKDHGGELRVESIPGKGACATVLLPVS